MKAEAGAADHSAVPQNLFVSPWPRRIALTLTCATFPLLFIGGLVTSKGAGLAVPDWPTSFGYNMFLYPWSKMVGNIFYEHSHRLVASFVGLLTIALAVTFWLREQRNWLRWLGVGALGLVIAQGIMGGLRVVLLEDTLAIVHAATAQAFFAVTVGLAVFTSAGWINGGTTKGLADGGRLRRLCALTTGLIYLQAIFGAILRHNGERLDAHLVFAALVALHVLLVLIRVSRHHSDRPELSRPALLLFGLLLLQLGLGALSYMAKYTTLLRLSLDPIVVITTSHLAVGALLLAASVVLTLRAFRLSRWARGRSSHGLFAEQLSA
ncbi:MAG TPA: COX15/CtaA family protein [Terriglobales bacterium]|jgi:cytochrome c oxidase assembly protein subunit 15|nr:COX15/CtaA family protein [Terriglobales bacterium]